jgi:predicted aspartyl protease
VLVGDQLVVMANGQHVTRHVGMAVIECGEFKTVDEVVSAQPGDLSLLGARTLEGFNAWAPPIARAREPITQKDR